MFLLAEKELQPTKSLKTGIKDSCWMVIFHRHILPLNLLITLLEYELACGKKMLESSELILIYRKYIQICSFKLQFGDYDAQFSYLNHLFVFLIG